MTTAEAKPEVRNGATSRCASFSLLMVNHAGRRQNALRLRDTYRHAVHSGRRSLCVKDIMRSSFTTLVLTALTVALQSDITAAERVYSNLQYWDGNTLFGETGDLFAQQFLVGENNEVTTVALGLFRNGSPNGSLDVQIWDDDGIGAPGQMVARVGTVEDLGSLDRRPSVSIGEALPDGATVFRTQIMGLQLNTPYYVVVSFEDVFGDNGNTVNWQLAERPEGANGAMEAQVFQPSDNEWRFLDQIPGVPDRPWYFNMAIEAELAQMSGTLRAGDADQNLDFDQLDLVQVQIAAKYLTGQTATWGDGDWDAAPGGKVGSPPVGDGLFNQMDIIAAVASGHYLTGPYAALQRNGQTSDDQTSVIYHAGTGELAVDVPDGVELTSINIDSAAGIFTGREAANLGGSFDNDADNNIFKATFGGSFGSTGFGNVAQTGLSEEFVLGDLTLIGSLAGDGDLGAIDLVYVPEPASAFLLAIGIVSGLAHGRRRLSRRIHNARMQSTFGEHHNG